jgi:hypothetical protein
LCPISGVELKFKELLPVKFTPIDERIEFNKLIAMKERYICPISRDVLTNSIRCVYLKTSLVLINYIFYIRSAVNYNFQNVFTIFMLIFPVLPYNKVKNKINFLVRLWFVLLV